MHSFENGASLRVKADNWSQLARLFLRAIPRVRLTDAVAEGVMRGAPGYAVDLIESLYVAFTLKELPPMAPLMRDESYAGPLVSGGGGGGGNGRGRFSPGTGGKRRVVARPARGRRRAGVAAAGGTDGRGAAGGAVRGDRDAAAGDRGAGEGEAREGGGEGADEIGEGGGEGTKRAAHVQIGVQMFLSSQSLVVFPESKVLYW